MAFQIKTLADAFAHGFDDVIDVRSPAEFAEDHVPGAINLPALDNAERAEVGTLYVQESPFLARKLGAALVARNAAAHLEGPLRDREGGWRPLVYCWRGGQRSGSFATILQAIGWQVEVLDGGYQSFRRRVQAALYDQPWPGRVVLLDGNTGTAKTEVLGRLADRGVQVLDLEGLAGHRGSLLGGQADPQPSQKGFETAIAQALATFDPARPVLVEAESNKIGLRVIPPSLWAAMKGADRIEIDAPPPARAAYLTQAYRDLTRDPDELIARLDRLIPLVGRDRRDHWAGLVAERAFEPLAAELIEHHYDPAYRRTRAKGAGAAFRVAVETLGTDALDQLADQIAGLAILKAG